MTTARERAREAVYDRHPSDFEHYPEDCADAASDVWEPLLRNLVKFARNHEDSFGFGWNVEGWDRILSEAEEALGD